MWNVYADLFKGNINLSVRWIFFRGLGGGVIFPCGLLGVFFFLFVFNCFWQNHCNAGSVGNGMAWKQTSPLRSSRSFPLIQEEETHRNSFYFFPPEQISSSAALFWAFSTIAKPHHGEKHSACRVRGGWGSFFTRRSQNWHPVFGQPIFVLEVYSSAVLPM